MSDWYWSSTRDGAHFCGPHNTKQEAIDEAKIELEREGNFYVGESMVQEVEVDADTVIEHWACQERDLLFEDALSYWCDRIPKEQKEALSEELTAVFKKHLELWDEESSWTVIRDAEHIL